MTSKRLHKKKALALLFFPAIPCAHPTDSSIMLGSFANSMRHNYAGSEDGPWGDGSEECGDHDSLRPHPGDGQGRQRSLGVSAVLSGFVE